MRRFQPLLVLLAASLGACGGGGASARASSPTAKSVLEDFDPAAPEASVNAAQAGISHSKLSFSVDERELGEVRQHQEYPLEFPFRVEGKDPVVITQVDTSCGCTNAKIEVEGKPYVVNDPIPPGAQGKVVATFAAGGFKGDKSSTITLRGNAENTPLRLGVHAHIQEIFILNPKEVQFGPVLQGKLRDKDPVIEVRVNAIEPFEILKWKTVPSEVSIEDTGKVETGPDGKRSLRWFRVELLHDAPVGRFFKPAIAETSLGRDLEFVVQADVFGPVTYNPFQRLSFGMLDRGQERVRNMNLRASSKEWKLPQPEVEIQGDTVFHAEVRTLQPGYEYVVKVRIAKDAPLGPHNAVLLVRYPEDSGIDPFQIPVKALVRDRR